MLDNYSKVYQMLKSRDNDDKPTLYSTVKLVSNLYLYSNKVIITRANRASRPVKDTTQKTLSIIQ
jgi:hypothetical protein